MSSRINIGVRHVLPLYASLRGDRGRGRGGTAARGRGRRWTTCAVFALFGWQVVSGALAHPDYISYTNEITRGRPENFVAESDLDWGQDMHRVGDFLRKAGRDRGQLHAIQRHVPAGRARVSQGHVQRLVPSGAGLERGEPGRVEGLQSSGLGRGSPAAVPHRPNALGVVLSRLR